ncbi:peptidylprolyl isomerase [Roseibium suaedae]|uniref:Parvulin-like PPIase n=1 Tax=Roseibium suaedae TaxID=735517 RepID=A0A1M7NBD0_9HYPH|nr:peptidylprolyl isomerase [Roseibium suaedae]SHN00416.1 peptidyl-prolyl cis-trans isomerase C [Roseibium suaedae]
MFRYSMRRQIRSLIVPALALTIAGTHAFAAEPGDVVAKVGSTEITEADLAFAAQDLGQELQRFPPAQWRSILLDVLVDMNLLADAAKKEGLDQSDDYKKQIDFLSMRALRNAYLAKEINDKITDEDVKAAYDTEFANFEGEEEMKARHILVKEKAEAEAIIKELDGGADFAELARSKSTGPSGPNGGDLGFFTKGQMVKPFEDATAALEPGQYTKEPVQTQFGWHVILLEEKRRQEKPTLEQVSANLRQKLIRDRYEAAMEKLKAENTVEILDETLAKPEEAK